VRQDPTASKCTCGSWPAVTAWLVVFMAGLAAHAQSHLAQSQLAQSGSLEYAVKATYLYKFGPFVEWPGAAFESPSSAINLCVVGDDPFGEILDQAVSGQRIGERPVAVRRLRTVGRESGCHIMYVAGSDAQSVAEILDTVRGTPVLTITDSAQDARAKGIIHFVIHDNRVRFEIDDYAAAGNGLMISSKVLSLALSVRPRA
jgi:hypothetical protein